jgi:hypothetical protein
VSIPGIDLLSVAFEVIGTQIINYRINTGREKNDQFQWVPKFDPFFDLEASIQRVPRRQYVQYNLEFQRNYVTVFASIDMIDLQRDTSGDQFIYGGRLYQLESQGTWFAQDGWAVCMAVDIGIAPVIPPVTP